MNEVKQIAYDIVVDLGYEDQFDAIWEKMHSLQFPTTRKAIENDVHWAVKQLKYDAILGPVTND